MVDDDAYVVVAVVECGDASSISQSSAAFDGLRKYRFRRRDLFLVGFDDGEDGEAAGETAVSSPSKADPLSYTGRQLRDAIVGRALRDCGGGCEPPAATADDDALTTERLASVVVEAYDRRSDQFVPLMRDDIRDIDAAPRFGGRVRCVIRGLNCFSCQGDHPVGSEGSESAGGLRDGGGSHDAVLAIQGRFFPYDPNGIEYAGGRLAVREVPNNQSDGTGLNVWDGALLLARYLEACPDKVRCKRVLELGSGCGLVGIAAGMLGAAEVVLTDLPYTLPLMRENVDSNADSISGAGCRRIECLPCDWNDPPPMDQLFSAREPAVGPSSENSSGADAVLIADCVWLEELVAPLLRTMEHVLEGSSSDLMVYISYQRRGKAAHEVFLSGIRSLFCTVKRDRKSVV